MSEMQSTSQKLPAAQHPNPFEEEGRRAPQRNIVGQLLKFTKFGTFAAGQDNVELPMGTRFIVNTDQLLKGWIKWENNKPVEQLMGLIVEGFVTPKRDTLGCGYKPGDTEAEADTSEWILDEQSGRMRDPWMFTYYMVMRELDKDDKPLDNDDGLYTYTTGSKGGVDAVAAFCNAFGKWFRLKPDDFPVIRLGWDHYEHSNPRFGWIKTPQFITGFITSEDVKMKRRHRLWQPNEPTGWMPKSMFGTIGEGKLQEDIPF
jgi:hypothetical protein